MQELIAKIHWLLERREDAYPVQDQSYRELIEAIAQLTELLLHQVKEISDTWKPDPQLVKKTHEFIEQPVFICGAMKTGTTLLTRLLDNHPSLLVMPGDSHYYTNFRKFSGDYADLCHYWMQRLVNPTGQCPFWFLGESIDSYIKFLLYLNYFLKTDYDTFQSVVAAVFCANPNRSMSTRYWVEKKPENEWYVQWLVKRFPRAKFLHIVRNPLPNIASIKKLNEFKAIPFRAISYSVRLKHLMKLGVDNLESLGNGTYKIIRYEDLLSEPEKEISALAAHLDIQIDTNLTIPSENGVPAKANSMYAANRITGSIAGWGDDKKWKSMLTQKEKEEIVTVLFSQAVSKDYEYWSDEEIRAFRKSSNLRGLWITLLARVIAFKQRFA
ncbi:MAG: sulfotransferase [Cytophagales bacterium]|nr:sulfotransferase [Cytophagales bacterium]